MAFSNKMARELFAPARNKSAAEILFFRLFEFFVMAYVIKFSWQWGFYIMQNSTVILPLGLANYLDISVLFHHALSLVLAGIITLIVVLSYFRIGFKWQYLLAMLLFHLQFAGRYSQGEIPHSANLIGLSLLAFGLGFIVWSDATKRSRFIFGVIIFFAGLGYTSAAFSKLIGTGLNWSDGNHLWLWLAEKKTDILSRNGAYHYNGLQQWALSNRWAATLILTIGWVTELCGVLFWWRSLRPYIVTAIILTHIGITLILNIRFDAFVYELILLGYPWAKWFQSYISYIPDRFNLKNRLLNTS